MKTLIIGMGEVGRALHEVLSAAHEVSTYDKTDDPKTLLLFKPTEVLKVLNICFPYSKGFEEYVGHYIDGVRPSLCIIHSTVPVGTTRKIQAEATQGCHVVHSPIHGQHPRLVEGIRTFAKYVGSVNDDNSWKAASACEFLQAAGINAVEVANAETSELSKLMCTAQTAMGILVQQEIARLCQQHGADFHEVYSLWNLRYNEGYRNLRGEANGDFSRPIYALKPGPLGGHCLFQNAALIDSWVTNAIRALGGEQSRANPAMFNYCNKKIGVMYCHLREGHAGECVMGEAFE